jgi:hypothetical protein
VEQGWQGTPDNILWSLIQSERRWLITADKGFAQICADIPLEVTGV